MEVLFSFPDLKITQNKGKLLFPLILLHGVAQDLKQCPGSLDSRNSHEQEPVSTASPSNILPQIGSFGEIDIVCEFCLKEQTFVALRVEGNVHSEVLTLFNAFPS